MQEEAEADLVHPIALAAGERLSDEPAQALPRREIPPLHVVGFASLLPYGFVLLLRDDLLVNVIFERVLSHSFVPDI
jgi:hypothetical protein